MLIIGVELFGDLTQAACASVKRTTKRNWVRLVGMRYDLQLWKPDDRTAPLTGFTRKYQQLIVFCNVFDKGRYSPNSISPTESWIPKILEPWRKAYKLLENCELFLPARVSSYVTLNLSNIFW